MSKVPKSRKRNRKAKLEVRDDVENQQAESVILQANPRRIIILPKLLSKPSCYDHTYSLIRSTESVTVPQLSIKVEVEELDESTISPNNAISITWPDIDKSTIRPNNNEIIIKPSNDKSTIGPNNAKSITWPDIDNSTISQKQNELIIKPSNDKSIISPNNAKSITWPNNPKSIIRPNNPKSIFSRNKPKSIIRPNNPKSIIRPNNPKPSIKSNKAKSIAMPNIDESIMINYAPIKPNIVETTTSSDNNTTNNMNASKKKTPCNDSRNKIRINVFYVDIEKMYELSDHISCSSDNVADKYLNIELKNRWGNILRSLDTDLHDKLIQAALNIWSAEHFGPHWKEPPLFYQCQICQLAWWYLTPFRDHIRTHDPQTLLVYHLTREETVIIANTERTNEITYIKCGGNCDRCGSGYEFHVNVNKCIECLELVVSCKLMQQHFPICMHKRHEQYNESMKSKCDICKDVFVSLESLQDHVVRVHTVRSDVPIPVIFKNCAVCEMKYYYYPIHMCIRNSMSSICEYCCRKFSSKMLANIHMISEGVESKCRVCDYMLPHRCMELAHLLTHSNNYQMVYKCPNLNCVPGMCFSDSESVKSHRIVYHKQRHDKRRSFFETVLLPKRLVKPEAVSDVDHILACSNDNNVGQKCVEIPTLPSTKELEKYISQKSKDGKTQEDAQIMDIELENEIKMKKNVAEDMDNNIEDSEMGYEDMLSKMFDIYEPKQQYKKVTEFSQDTSHKQYSVTVPKSKQVQDKQIKAKKKKKSEKLTLTAVRVSDTAANSSARVFNVTDANIIPLKISKKSETNETTRKSVSKSRKVSSVERPKESFTLSNYEETLSKVFRVSDSFAKSLIGTVDTEIAIKTEAEEISFEDLIDIQENPITIKEEPIDIEYNHDQIVESGYNHDQIVDSGCNYDQNVDSGYNHDQIVDSGYNHDQIVDSGCNYDQNVDSGYNHDQIVDSGYNHDQIVDSGYNHDQIGDSRYNNNQNVDSKCNTDQIVDNNNLSRQSPSEEFKFEIRPIKIEPKECEIDISPIKIKPQIKQELLIEATDMTIIESTEENIQKQPETVQNSEINNENLKPKIKIERTDGENIEKTKKDDGNQPKYKFKGRRKVYYCAKCGYSNNHKLYQIHRKSKCLLTPTTDQIYKHKCTKCDTTFNSLKAYLLHFESHGYEEMRCPECYMKFDDLKDMIPHFHRHIRFNYVNCWMIDKDMVQRENKNRCQICQENVKQMHFFSHWEAHLKLRTNAQFDTEPPPVSITSSEQTGGSKKTLPPDVLNDALEQLRAITSDKICHVCNREFSRRTDIKRHIIEHLLLDAYSKKENTPDNTFVCQLCSARHRAPDRYKFHMRAHGALPVYRCERCDKTFSDSSNFAKHKKTHSMKVLICDICNKKFNAKLSLEKHMMMHRVTEPIKCNLCPKEFYSMSPYNKHMQTRHVRLTRFRCVLCDLWFDSLRRKWDHAWAVHKERKHAADCPVCRKQFRKYADVRTHALKDHDLELHYFKSTPDQRNSILRTKTVKSAKTKQKDT